MSNNSSKDQQYYQFEYTLDHYLTVYDPQFAEELPNKVLIELLSLYLIHIEPYEALSDLTDTSEAVWDIPRMLSKVLIAEVNGSETKGLMEELYQLLKDNGLKALEYYINDVIDKRNGGFPDPYYNPIIKREREKMKREENE